MADNDRVRTICLLILTIIAIGGALHWLQPVMVPFVLALFFALALSPLIDYLERRVHAPRGLAIALTLLLGLVLLILFGILVSVSVGQMEEDFDLYAQRFKELVDHVEGYLPISSGQLFDYLRVEARVVLLEAANAIWSLLSLGILVVIFMCFLLTGKRITPSGGAWSEVKLRVRRYLATKIAVSAVTGVLVWATLALLEIDLALVFGLFAFLLNFIPNIGSILSTALPLPVVLLGPDVSTTTAILAIAIPGAIQFTVGNALEPRIMGTAVDLHPVTILMALIFWGMLWGFVGMLLSVPLTAVLKIVFERMELTAPVAEILAGRRPPTDA